MNVDPQQLTPLIVGYGTRLAGAVLLLFIAWIIAAWAKRIVSRRFEAAKLDVMLGGFFASMARWLVLLVAVLACLGIFGVQTTSVAALVGAAGLAVGLAFQGSLSNFAAGMMLLVFRPFGIGDYVSVAGTSGTVVALELFTTSFDTPDNRRIIVPNSLIFGETIENFTYHSVRRVDVGVGVDYAADIDRTREILERAVASVEGRLDTPASQVFLKELGASSVDWIVRVWCETADFWSVHEATVRAVKRHLDDAAIGIPFPQMDVHLDGRLGD
jgi:small conductance mechanosensitive channel